MPGIEEPIPRQGYCEVCQSWQSQLQLCRRCGSLTGECCLAVGSTLCLFCFYDDWNEAQPKETV